MAISKSLILGWVWCLIKSNRTVCSTLFVGHLCMLLLRFLREKDTMVLRWISSLVGCCCLCWWQGTNPFMTRMWWLCIRRVHNDNVSLALLVLLLLPPLLKLFAENRSGGPEAALQVVVAKGFLYLGVHIHVILHRLQCVYLFFFFFHIGFGFWHYLHWY